MVNDCFCGIISFTTNATFSKSLCPIKWLFWPEYHTSPFRSSLFPAFYFYLIFLVSWIENSPALQYWILFRTGLVVLLNVLIYTWKIDIVRTADICLLAAIHFSFIKKGFSVLNLFTLCVSYFWPICICSFCSPVILRIKLQQILFEHKHPWFECRILHASAKFSARGQEKCINQHPKMNHFPHL